jgi:uncharacterized membrane protein
MNGCYDSFARIPLKSGAPVILPFILCCFLQLCDKAMQGGLRPSSLMALINMCGSFAAAALMPLLGAVVSTFGGLPRFLLLMCLFLLLSVLSLLHSSF